MDSERDTTLEDIDIDATDLVIDEMPVDDDNDYEEIIILDLRRPESHDLWLN